MPKDIRTAKELRRHYLPASLLPEPPEERWERLVKEALHRANEALRKTRKEKS